jgi:CheY-like chemotaxis protein
MPKAKVLLAEDEAVTARVAEKMLKALGYEVCAVISEGQDAIERTGESRPDLVLMDIVLKGKVDGIEAADAIRTRFDIPVVYLTSCSDEETLERAKISGPFGYMVKPLNERELHVVIEMALFRHKADAEREGLIRKLRKALEEIRTLSDLLPICAWCKKIRDDAGYWQQIETYFREHSKTRFTHGICPECARKHFARLQDTP